MTLDQIDKDIIAILLKNGNLSIREVAAKLSTSHSTVQYHLSKLQDSGLVIRRSISLDLSLVPGKHIFIGIRCLRGKERQVQKVLTAESCVIQLFSLSGSFDYLAEFFSPNPQDLDLFREALTDLADYQLFSILNVEKRDHIPL